jgi:cytidylate kinase
VLITISRQYAAGGAIVAQRIAEALRWSVVDSEFIVQVAERAGLPPEEVARLEERPPTFMERLARATALELPDLFMPTAGPVEEFEEAKLVRITRNLVSDLAREGRMVIVGRAAAAVLGEAVDALHARVVGPRDFRIRTAVDLLGVDAARAAKLLDETDRNRARYHREFYDRDWNDPVHYHMVLNTGWLGFDGAAELIVARARSLGWGR